MVAAMAGFWFAADSGACYASMWTARLQAIQERVYRAQSVEHGQYLSIVAVRFAGRARQGISGAQREQAPGRQSTCAVLARELRDQVRC